MSMSNKKFKIHYAWIMLFALCIIRSLSAAGINNTGGIFLSPVSSDIGVGIGTLSIYFSISSIATLIFMPIAGKLIQKHSIKAMMIVAALLQCLSFMALGLMNSVWAWYILSVPMGVGGAILVNLCGPVLINRWFKSHAGTALGILMACVGVFGAVLQPLTVNSVNNLGWRNTYFFMGCIILITIIALTVVLIKNKPEDKSTKPFLIPEKGKDIKKELYIDVPYKNAVKSPAFMGLLVFMVAITAFGAFNQHMATYLQSLGYSSIQVSPVLSISMIGSTVGAILIGFLSDKIGVYKTTIGVIGVVVGSIICLGLGSQYLWILSLGSFLLGLASIGIPVLAPLLTKSFFGNKDYESIYSSVMMGPPLATVILLPLYGFVFDATGSYKMVILLIAAIIVIGTVGFVLGTKSKKHD